MANKLYEETHIADIADAIREANGTKDTYTVAQMGDAVRGNRRVYTGELTETIVGLGAYTVLFNDPVLVEHREDDTLFIRVEFDVGAIPNTVVKSWACNVGKFLPVDGLTTYLINGRLGADASWDGNAYTNPIKANAGAGGGVGYIEISDTGDLRIYSNSSSTYHLRPSEWKAIVEW